MSRVTWGVLGCANFARTRAIPAMLKAPSVELVGVASRDTAKAEGFRSEFGLARAYPSYEAMLEDPGLQAIYIPLPNGLHAEWTIRAAQAGKHVLCEKPLTSDAREAQEVADAVQRAGVFLMEAFMWRLHPQHDYARGLIENGDIGTVRLVRAAFTFSIQRKPNVRLNADLAGGSVMDVGCYTISGARHYFGTEPTRVVAGGEIDAEYGVDMSMSGILDFPTGRAMIDCGFHLPFRCDLEIVGDTGRIYIPKAWLPDEEAAVVFNGTETRFPATNQYVTEFEHFSQCVRTGTPPRFGPDDAVRQMRVVDAVRHAIRSGATESI